MKALITGASSGLGKDMALVLGKKGWDLILVARRADRLENVKNQINNVNVQCIIADVSKTEECEKLYERTKDENVDMIINNAGFGDCGKFLETDLERELNMIDTNIKAVHILTKLFLHDFAQRNSGYILNVASSAGFMAGPLMATYYATKNYVLRLTEAIYQELRQDKINVHISALCPGPVETEFNQVASVKFAIKGLDSCQVAEYAIEQALKGKLIIVPGTAMKFAKFGGRFMPDKAMLRMCYKIQYHKV